jgi:molybdate transport system permease protein
VPAGSYARQSLEHFGWYSALDARLTRSASTSAAMLLVERGEVEAGIVYRSQVAGADRVAVVAEFPSHSHAPIRYPTALLAGAGPEAQAFVSWLDSPSARALIAAWRFEPLRGAVAETAGHAASVRAEAGNVGQAVRLSLQVASASVLLLILPGLGLGWLLARRQFRGKAVLSSLVHLPLVIPPVATGYLLLLLLGVNGPVGRWLHETFGLRLAFHWTGAAVASAVVALPLMVRSVRLAMSAVDVRLEAAARTLGSGQLGTFLTVTLPLSWPGLLAGCVLAFARSLGEFGATITFAGNLAGQTRTLPLAAYSHMQTPGGQDATMQLVMISVALSTLSVLTIEWLGDRSGQAGKGAMT